MSLADAEGWGAVYQEQEDMRAQQNAIDAASGPGWYDWLADQWNNVTGTVGTGKTPNTLQQRADWRGSPALIAVAVGVAVYFGARALR